MIEIRLIKIAGIAGCLCSICMLPCFLPPKNVVNLLPFQSCSRSHLFFNRKFIGASITSPLVSSRLGGSDKKIGAIWTKEHSFQSAGSDLRSALSIQCPGRGSGTVSQALKGIFNTQQTYHVSAMYTAPNVDRWLFGPFKDIYISSRASRFSPR